ncbi:MAG: ferritin-like domain-containing protein, partial [Proteobacteria bacterium]|nr:ferritin-like domain-containing protein [Pseudomonadota bacterium]
KYGGTIQLGEWDTDRSQDIKEMLKKDVQLEQEAKKRYSSQIEQFRDYAEVRTLLESVLADEEDHEIEFTRYLADC